MVDDDDERGPAAREPAPPPRTRGRVEDGARRRIGHDLQLLYASVLDQPLPERLIRLVDDLTRQEDREGSR